MKDRILDFSDVIEGVFGPPEGFEGQPASKVRPTDHQTTKKGDTLPCPPSGETVPQEPVTIAIEEAKDDVVETVVRSTADDVKTQVPMLDPFQREVLIDQYLDRFLDLAESAPNRIRFLRMLWQLQDEMVKVPAVADEVLQVMERIFLDNDFVMPGSEPVEQRTWRVIWLQFIDFRSEKSHRMIARNTYTKLRKPVKLYDVLHGLQLSE
ncbi:MAG: hypothetical protein R3B71_03850 [Candidatus Gracilibacteria bacterium]